MQNVFHLLPLHTILLHYATRQSCTPFVSSAVMIYSASGTPKFFSSANLMGGSCLALVILQRTVRFRTYRHSDQVGWTQAVAQLAGMRRIQIPPW